MAATEIDTAQDALRRWPRLTAHLICESLGYFTPSSAAVALLRHHQGNEHWCEWYLHMAGLSGKDLLSVGRETVARAFQWRHRHEGYMASYLLARKLVEMELAGEGKCVFASWF